MPKQNFNFTRLNFNGFKTLCCLVKKLLVKLRNCDIMFSLRATFCMRQMT